MSASLFFATCLVSDTETHEWFRFGIFGEGHEWDHEANREMAQSIDSKPLSPNFKVQMNTSRDNLVFFRITQISCGISFGIFASFVWSIQEITPSFRLALSAGSGIAFVLGAIAGAKFWKMAWDARSGKADSKLKGKFIAWGIGFALFTVGSFAYSLRGHTHEKLVEYAIGTGTAVVFLTIAGSLLFFIARHFNNDQPK